MSSDCGKWQPPAAAVEREAQRLCAVHCEATPYGMAWANLSSDVRDAYRFEARRNLTLQHERERPLIERLRAWGSLSGPIGAQARETLAAHDRMDREPVAEPTLADEAEELVESLLPGHVAEVGAVTYVMVTRGRYDALKAALARERGAKP